MHELLLTPIVFLIAAVTLVPLAQRLGLGSVLGYLIGGCIIGPWGLAMVKNVELISHIAEIGVVLMLFLIGLELQRKNCWPCASWCWAAAPFRWRCAAWRWRALRG